MKYKVGDILVWKDLVMEKDIQWYEITGINFDNKQYKLKLLKDFSNDGIKEYHDFNNISWVDNNKWARLSTKLDRALL